jgi:hypothetical protein
MRDGETREVTDWLQSPEGEEWSHQAIKGRALEARQRKAGPVFMPGMFSILIEAGTGYHSEGNDDLWRGSLAQR